MKRIFLLVLFLAGTIYAQSPQTPDCSQSLSFTRAQAGTVLPVNTGAQNGCATFRLTWVVTGFSAVTISLQGSQDNSTFANFISTLVLEGTNPTSWTSATTSNSIVVQGYLPYVRVNISSVTGTGTVATTLLGWRGTTPATGGGGAGGLSDVNIADVAGTATVTGGVAGLLGVGGAAADGANSAGNPVLIGGHDTAATPKAHIVQTDTFGDIVLAGVSASQSDGSSNTPTIPGLGTAGSPTPSTQRSFPFKFNGSTWDRDFICASSAEVALSGTGYTEIVAASGSTVIRVCKVMVTSASSGTPVVNTFTAAFGTCASSPTEIFNLAGITGMDSDFPGALRGASGTAFCMKESTANSDKVTVLYARY
jgi:hypothetical protein